jgi:hypothetical protein
MTTETTFDRLPVLCSPSWLTMVSLDPYTVQTSLMHSAVELCGIIRASVVASLEGALEGGHSHVQPDTVSLLDRLANRFEWKEPDTDYFENGEDGSNETGVGGGDDSMEVVWA